MKVKHLFEHADLPSCIDEIRVKYIIDTIKTEITSRKRDFWNMNFDKYLDERMGDMDAASAINLEMENQDGEENDDWNEAWDQMKAYIKLVVSPAIARVP